MPDDTSNTNQTNQNDSNNQENSNNTNNTQSTGNCVYDKYGRTPDKSQICAIGIKSASADVEKGVVKCVFENKCAHCGKPALMWGWHWDNDPEKIKKFDGTDGTAEGHIYCVQSEGGCDADFSIEGNEHINGSTAKLTLVSGPTPSSEEEAEKLSNGELACDGTQVPSSGSTSAGGSAVLIPDKTFYGLIKQILGAIDGIFVIANNMAYLLSFKDMYRYRNLYEEYIPEIKMSDIAIDGVTHNWTTEGCYNAVEVTYADGMIRYQHDALIELYGENIFYYEFPEDDEETAKAKAKALLGAHIRDYSLDIELDCVYNPNITAGSWVKIPKTLTKVSNTNKKGPIKKLYKKKEKQVRKGVNITNINEIVQQIDDHEKTIEHITTEDGEQYDIEIEKKDYEIYFVQSYRFRWTPKHAPIMSLLLKYGPDTPEDPVNATIGVGGVQTTSSGGSSAGAMYGDDCFGVEIAQLEGDYRIPHDGSGGIEYATQNPPSEQMTAGRCKQGSTYEKEVAGKTAEEAYYIASSKFVYCCYADNCSKYKCNEERWTSGECGFNCGDCATILKSVLDCVGQKNWIFHIDQHYHTMIDDNGTIKSVDLSRGILKGGDSNTHSVGWPVAHTGSCGCSCRTC